MMFFPVPVDQQAIDECRRDHNYLDQIVRRKGVLAFDPATPAGREVWELFDAFAAASNPQRDPAVRLQGVELAVEAVLLKRSVMTQIMEMGGVIDIEGSRTGGGRRSAMALAVQIWRTCTQQLETACEMMGIEGYAALKVAADNPEDLKTLLARKAEQVQTAEFRPVIPSSPDATATAPATSQPDPPPSSASSSDAADAPGATPEPPASP